MDMITFIVFTVILFILLAAVFRKFFLVPLFLGMTCLGFGIALLLTGLDNLQGLRNQIGNFLDSSRYDQYLFLKNLGIILIVTGAILVLLGLIFAIKSGQKKKYPMSVYTAVCQSCKSPLPAGVSFCPHCGKPVFPAPAAPSSVPEVSGIKPLCPVCGAENKENAKFCEDCGTKLS